MEENNITVDKAVQTIKGAILRAQAQASQSSNAIQLSLYYGIGRYVVHPRIALVESFNPSNSSLKYSSSLNP